MKRPVGLKQTNIPVNDFSTMGSTLKTAANDNTHDYNLKKQTNYSFPIICLSVWVLVLGLCECWTAAVCRRTCESSWLLHWRAAPSGPLALERRPRHRNTAQLRSAPLLSSSGLFAVSAAHRNIRPCQSFCFCSAKE